jgi:NAD(P)-dependent dehydrogenase (short-subunit alcohol dehydrogenase family)
MKRRWPLALAVLSLALCTLAGPAAVADGDTAEHSAGTVVITGASRGIGLEFARQYAQLGWRVIATCRTPAEADELQALAADFPALSVDELDITELADVAALAARYRDQPVDILINNAAYLGDMAAQRFGSLDYAKFQIALNVNLLGMLRVSEALLDNVLSSEHGKIIVLGSAAGSNGLLGPGEPLYAYRASKAALHFTTHELALELAPKGVIVGLINPGLVDTKGVLDLQPGEPVPEVFQPLMPLIESGELPLIRAEESVRAMIGLIDELQPERAGRFWNYDGQELPW